MRISPFIAALLIMGCVASPEPGGSERFPTPEDYPPGVMEEITFTAGGEHPWRLAALRTPPRPEAPWRIVVVTGTPSWPEFWAPTIARAPDTREMIVITRPGFQDSEPQDAVRDIAAQAAALAPALDGPPGQRVVLLGQSFGAPVATLLAAQRPDRVRALVYVSGFFGDRGPTAQRLLGVGRIVAPILPRDFRNSVREVAAQGPQLPPVWDALRSLDIPIVFLHGDADTFVPIEADRRIAAEFGHTLIAVPGGDHFLNACCVDATLAATEQAIAEAEGRERAQPPAAP
ncbi:MAG: alpha/beta fold hydrolase [Hyphomonadaceae bacterium]